jgi:N-methylhydantoinase B/oxoprolinase/acetone carboxylase alpha subunit
MMKSERMREGVDLNDVEYEILSYRLYAIVNEARQAIMRVSGSPVVAEGGEALFAIYNAEGLTATLACGLLLHIMGTQSFIEEILELQPEHPGINDGDIFMYNEPSIGGIHACDQWLGTPIFREGQLVAWLGALTHTAETGAIEPGGMPPGSRSFLHEGYRVQGIRFRRGI